MTRCKFLLLLLCCALFGNAFAQDCPRIYRSGDTLKTDPAGGYQWFFNGNPIPNATSQWFLAKDKGNYTVEVSGTSYPFPVIFGKNELIGRVFDHKYEPVAGAKITLIDQTTVTDAQGNFRFASVSNLLPTAVLTATKESYWKNVQRVTFFKNSPTFVNLMMDTLLVTNKVDAQKGAIVSDRGFTLQIPPNGVVTADGQTYQGTINLSLKRGFPSEENFGYRMPGGDFSAIDANGQEKILISYGFMSAEMHGDNGEELKLAPEAEATLEFYTSFAGNKVNPDSMPLWHFDEVSGMWFPEGTARKVGPRYMGTVKHFSSWNCDVPTGRATVKGKVVNCKKQPPSVRIPVQVGQRTVTVDAQGYYTSFVPSATTFDVTASVDTATVTPLTEGEERTVKDLEANTIMDAVGLIDSTGTLTVYGYGIKEYSVDSGKTFQPKSQKLNFKDNYPTKGVTRDSSDCEANFRIHVIPKQGDCQLLDRVALAQKMYYTDLLEALSSQGTVYRLSLTSQSLSNEKIMIISTFPCLQVLNLNFNQMTSVPESIGQLTNLQYLGLDDNQLTSLPEFIGQLTNLQVLNLEGNKLMIVPEFIGQLANLQELNFGFNQLGFVPKSIGQLTNLQVLALGGNYLTSVPEFIQKFNNLQELNLGANRLTIVPEFIGQLGKLQKLVLTNNNLTSLPSTISNLKGSLKTLELQTNPISEEEKAKIQSWLPNTYIMW